MLISNVNMASTTNCSSPRKNTPNNCSSVSFQAAPSMKAMKLPGKKIIQFFKDLKIGETAKKMFDVVKNSKAVQNSLTFITKVGKSIVNSKFVQNSINFVKNIFKKPTP